MEEAREEADGRPDPAWQPDCPEVLGDFRIVRELGRGGMGVVYEAVQTSLGRRVALKILPPPWHQDRARRSRFQREARAAAALQHPHIVPVYSVGEHDGIPFYAMEFIRGRSLDRFLRRPPHDGDPSSPPGLSAPRLTAEDSPSRHFRAVARIGVQAAEAIAWVHRQGLLHRDIKPSNFLLDEQGNVRLTDFGLSRPEVSEQHLPANAAGDDSRPIGPGGGRDIAGMPADADSGLAQSFDVLGTLRYMAPERLRGESGRPCDLYSLGIMLYELLTRQPAFSANDRDGLAERVLRGDLPRLRQRVRRIPHDLDAIVMKAASLRPESRYRSAEELAEDLTRFLDGWPIRARSAGPLRHTWLWFWRSPTRAVLVGIALSATVGAWLFYRERNEKMWISHLAQAQASRLSGRDGGRLEALAELAQAAAYRPGLAARNEAIACLTSVDLRVVARWAGGLAAGEGVAVDRSFGRYARSDTRGEISVRRIDDDRELSRLPGGGHPAWDLRFSPDGQFLTAIYRSGEQFQLWDLERGQRVRGIPSVISGVAWDFSPDGRLLAVGRRDGTITLHDLRSHLLAGVLPRGIGADHLAFHPHGHLLAVSSVENPGRLVQIRDLGTGEVRMTLKHPAEVRGLAWRDDGKLLATACGEAICVWDVSEDLPDQDRPRAMLKGHETTVTHVAFNHCGDLLASYGWDGMVRLWDPWTGRQHVSSPGAPWIRFSPDDARLAGALVGNDVGIWEVADGRGFRMLHGHEGKGPWFVDFSPDGTILASASFDGVRIWEADRGNEPIGSVPAGPSGSVLFHPDGKSLLSSGLAGLMHWPLAILQAGEGRRIEIGPPEPLGVSSPYFQSHMDRDRRGRVLGVVKSRYRAGLGQAVVLSLDDPSRRILLRGSSGLESIAVSPDGHWAATGDWLGSSTRIWEVGGGVRGPIFRLIFSRPATLSSPSARTGSVW